MIIYNNELSSRFELFGINIPVKDNRSELVFKSLPREKVYILDDVKILDQDQLKKVHQGHFIDNLYNENLKFEIDRCFELEKYRGDSNIDYENFRDHIVFQVSATVESFKKLDENRFIYHLGGGMHHAHYDQGRGFCLLNDIVLAATLENKSAWIIDLDAHKGDGTAALAKDRKDLTTLSIHMQDGWPLENKDEEEKEKPWFIPSNIDIPVTLNSEYLVDLSCGLHKLEKFEKPDVAIIVAGSDPYINDSLDSAKLIQLSKDEMLKRDILVYEFLKNKDIPQFYVMAGGYGPSSHEIYSQFLNYLIDNNEI